MKKYVLTNEESRAAVDLRNYETVIANAVMKVSDDDEVLVGIAQDYYDVTPALDAAQEAAVDNLLCGSALKIHQKNGHTLFVTAQ